MPSGPTATSRGADCAKFAVAAGSVVPAIGADDGTALGDQTEIPITATKTLQATPASTRQKNGPLALCTSRPNGNGLGFCMTPVAEGSSGSCASRISNFAQNCKSCAAPDNSSLRKTSPTTWYACHVRRDPDSDKREAMADLCAGPCNSPSTKAERSSSCIVCSSVIACCIAVGFTTACPSDAPAGVSIWQKSTHAREKSGTARFR